MEYGGFSSQEELREWVDDYSDRSEQAEHSLLAFYFDSARAIEGIKTAAKGRDDL